MAVETQINLINSYTFFWGIKEQNLKRCVNMVCFCKTKETKGETKRIKVKDCFWDTKFDKWVNSEWLREQIGMGPRRVGKFLNFQNFQEISKQYLGRWLDNDEDWKFKPVKVYEQENISRIKALSFLYNYRTLQQGFFDNPYFFILLRQQSTLISAPLWEPSATLSVELDNSFKYYAQLRL